MSKEKHTPFNLEKDDMLFRPDLIVDKNNLIICEMTQLSTHRQTSEFIIKACNNHDRLVEALRDMIQLQGFDENFDARENAKQLLSEIGRLSDGWLFGDSYHRNATIQNNKLTKALRKTMDYIQLDFEAGIISPMEYLEFDEAKQLLTELK